MKKYVALIMATFLLSSAAHAAVGRQTDQVNCRDVIERINQQLKAQRDARAAGEQRPGETVVDPNAGTAR